MRQYLITSDEVPLLARGMSIHIEQEKIETYIRESEDIDIKPSIGDALFIDIQEHSEKYDILMNGGVYEDRYGKHVMTGLKTALAYYAYARLVKNGDGNVTRYGYVNKDDDYSSRPDSKERVMAYNDAFSIADSYMKECLQYLKTHKNEFPLYKGEGGLKANRTVFRIIGD